MSKYAILMKPQYNIAFEEDYHCLCKLELALVLQAMGGKAEEIEIEKVHKGHWLTFSYDASLSEEEKTAVYRLSFFYMLLELEEERTYFVPIGYEPVFPEDLSTRLKYNGKTNEAITRLMLNVALSLAGKINEDGSVNVLDPMCGKGTTLFEAMSDGLNAYGIDESRPAIHDMNIYFSKYLQDGHYKHSMEKGKAIVAGKNLGETLTFSVARDKEAAKRKEFIEMKCIAAETAKGAGAFKKGMMDVIVCDLPYGIAHIGKKGKGATRSLDVVMDEALGPWNRLLKRGGVIALAWNTYTDSRETLVACLEDNGFSLCTETADMDFGHRVSQAINRNLLFAVKV